MPTTTTTQPLSDAALAAMTIEDRNHYLDWDSPAALAQQEAEGVWEAAAEAAAERFWEEGPHGGYYAGSQEEARDRWLDSLQGR
jgi:hypothetical protein